MALTKSVVEIVEQDTSGLLGSHPHWQRVALREVAQVLNGFPFDSTGFNAEKGMPLARIRDVIVGNTSTRFDGPYDPAYVLGDGDLLVGMDGDFNCGRWRGGPALLNQRVCKISVDSRLYEPRLLDAVLPLYLAAINAETSSVTVKHLSSRTIEDICLPLPPRAEQIRLADRLDELLGDLVSAMGELKAAQRKLALYRQSLLSSAIEGSLTAHWRLERVRQPPIVGALPHGWIWAPLSQYCSVVSGYAFSSKSFITSGIPVAKIANVGHGCYVDGSGMDHLAASFEESHADFLVEPGDILIALTRPITNDRLKSCRYPDGRPRALLNQRVAALRPLAPALAQYLFHVTCSTYFRECMAAAATQTLQPNVSPKSLRSFLVPIPPTEEAVFISDCLDQALSGAAAVETEVDQVLNRGNAQRQNILRAAFSGQLVPQDPNDEPASVLLERIRAQRPVSGTAPKRKPGRPAKVAA